MANNIIAFTPSTDISPDSAGLDRDKYIEDLQAVVEVLSAISDKHDVPIKNISSDLNYLLVSKDIIENIIPND